LSLYAEMRAYLEEAPRRAIRPWDETDAIPTGYAGTEFRSRLEAGWAATLDLYGIAWEYEPEKVRLASGKGYVPDFRLPELATVIEAKGPHMNRLDKTREYAKENPQTVVIVGYSPAQRTLSPYVWESYMQWGDALGGSALFTECLGCGAKQWCRPRLSMRCRRCDERFTGHFAACGEMRFTPWKDDESYSAPGWEPAALCPGSASMTSSRFTARWMACRMLHTVFTPRRSSGARGTLQTVSCPKRISTA
jgi:hypothetical protein